MPGEAAALSGGPAEGTSPGGRPAEAEQSDQDGDDARADRRQRGAQRGGNGGDLDRNVAASARPAIGAPLPVHVPLHGARDPERSTSGDFGSRTAVEHGELSYPC